MWTFKTGKHLLFAILLVALNTPICQARQDAPATDKKKQIDQAQAVETARKRVDGRVLRVDKNKSTYRVKMLQQSGRVISIDVDRQTGRVKQANSPIIKKKDS